MENEIKMTPTSHRQGTLVDILDKIQSVVALSNSIPLTPINTDMFYNQEHMDKIIDKLRDLREFDITTIGDLYLTSGGRVVLDRGYGEYFTKGDIKLFTLEELKNGIPFNEFLKKIKNSDKNE